MTVQIGDITVIDENRIINNVPEATFTGKTAIKISAGSTSERPNPPILGQIRFNNDTKQYEGYNGTRWNILSDSIDDYFNTLNATSMVYDSNGNLTSITYSTGNKQVLTYTGDQKIEIKYYDVDGATLMATNTVYFANNNATSTSWSYP